MWNVNASLKAACCLVQSPEGAGTGYLVDSDTVVTSVRALGSLDVGGTVSLRFSDGLMSGTIVARSKAPDIAILRLTGAREGALTLAEKESAERAWTSAGFSCVEANEPETTTGTCVPRSGAGDSLLLLDLQTAERLVAPSSAWFGAPILSSGGRVMGHVSRALPHPLDDARHAFGLVEAVPAAAIRTALDAAAATRPVVSRETELPTTGPVLLVYRVGDRGRACHLAARLEGLGLPVRLDARAPLSSPESLKALERELERCRTAVVLASREWMRAGGRQHDERVLSRAKRVRVIRCVIDDANAETSLRGDVVDLSDSVRPTAEGVCRLLEALRIPTDDMVRAEQEALDAFIADVADASASGSSAVLALWRAWAGAGLAAAIAAPFAAEALIELADPRDAIDVLGSARDGRRTEQLRAFALGRSGDVDASIRILKELARDAPSDSETNGLLGGRYKQRWLTTNDPAALNDAFRVYRDAWRATRDTYPGINAATLALQLDLQGEATALAEDVLAELDQLPESDIDRWKFATRGGAHLILGSVEKAKTWFQRAVSANPHAVGDITTMRREARLILKELGLPEDAVDRVLRVRSTLAFSGHRTVRLPESTLDWLRLEVRNRLQALNAGYGFSSAADGADIIFLEELLERGGRARVFLPFDRERFVSTSVADAWRARFDIVLADPRVHLTVLEGTPESIDEEAQAFRRCNDAIAEEAIAFAERLDDRATLLVAHDGSPAAGAGGTEEFATAWSARGHDVSVISVPTGQRALMVAVVNAGEAEAEPIDADYRAKHAVCIGIGAYQHWIRLLNPVRDATDVANVLESRYGFETARLFDEAATSERIAATIVERAKSVDENDLVVIYFAGHGHTTKLGDRQVGFIVPVGAPRQREDRLISMDTLTEWSNWFRCRHVLYIFDSCFSGMLTLRSDIDRHGRDMLKRKARIGITAGGADQPVVDGGADGHSVFTARLLDALGGDLEPPRGYFTATELYAYLSQRVPIAAPQTPVLGYIGDHQTGDVLFRPGE